MTVIVIPKNYYVYVAVFIGHIGAFIAALSMTWSSPILSKLSSLEDNPLGRIITSTEQSILGSIPTIGTFIGTFSSSYLAGKFGRKPVMIGLGVPTIICYVLMTLSTYIWELYLARILGGITLGGIFTVNTMYFAEVAENSNRGLLGTAMICFVNFGLLFVLILGPLSTYFWFHVVLSIFPAVFMILVYIFLPESPYYLILIDPERAEASLKKLRGSSDVENELNAIKNSLQKNNQIYLKDLLSKKGLRKGLFIGCGLILFQQLSGTAVIMSYGQLIFAEANEGISSEMGPIIIAGLQFLVGFITPLFIDRTGRIILLLISYVGMTLAHMTFGLYFFMKDSGGNVSAISWLPLASLVAYIITYSIGSGPIPWSLIGEIFPLEVKGVATSVCIVVLNICAFVLIVSFNSMKDFFGLGQTFWIFGTSCIIAAIFSKFYIIETKGKSLMEIQTLLDA
ncbi:hypothetical protein HHI36_008556 [Cryptolaemus montrouzieri]|uniref:Major facilitator superfamily (MFS) profile domain-containing protein n=1 Tax=Cryptolaemus montrouzieri TaxID=559131 RepID=A0ABD2MSW9_9CUCU